MLDVLLIPVVLLTAFALRAIWRGDHRRHSHLMTAAATIAGLRILLWPRAFSAHLVEAAAALFGLAGITMILGSVSLGWREGRNQHNHVPRYHRAMGRLTLVSFALALVVWLLRSRV